MDSDAVARIRTTALRNNLNQAKQCAPECPVLAVVKADAYGHGLIEVATALDAADALAVARFPAAETLRAAGIGKNILVMSGRLTAESAALARDLDLQVVVYDEAQLPILTTTGAQQAIKVWLKIDSGMGRLGIAPDRFTETLATLQDSSGVDPDICLMTHLACADDLDSPVTVEQLRVFGETIGDWHGDVSIANSAGILGWPAAVRPGASLRYSGRNWIRPGLMLYGVSPLLSRTAEQCGLAPVMTLEGRILSVRDIPEGAAVGYAAEWRAQRNSRIGVVNIGYADGYPWRLSNQAVVQVAGQQAAVVGRVSMDMICIDLTGLPAAGTGDSVILWGEKPNVTALAGLVGTSPYELLTGVGQRVQRIIE